MANDQRARSDPIIVPSTAVMLYEDPCYDLFAYTAVAGGRAWARVPPRDDPTVQ